MAAKQQAKAKAEQDNVKLSALGGDQELEDKMQRLKPKHINFAVRGDDELSKLMATTQISDGGTLPHIEAGGYLKVERQAMKRAANKEKA